MPSSDSELRLTLSGGIDIDVGEHFPGRDGDDCGLGGI